MNLQNEPAQIIAYITAAATAMISLLVAYGVDISEDQKQAILGAVAILAPIVAGLVIRSRVYAPATVAKIADRQYAAGVPPTDPQPDVPKPPGV